MARNAGRTCGWGPFRRPGAGTLLRLVRSGERPVPNHEQPVYQRVSADVEPLRYRPAAVGRPDPPRRRLYGMIMIENQKIRPAQVIGPLGQPLTLASLPPPNTTRSVLPRTAHPVPPATSGPRLRHTASATTD